MIGIEEDGLGNLSSLIGVDLLRGFKQQVIQWCYDGIYPPITPDISNPIPNPQKPDNFFYVIYIEESHEAPHFINGRKGCYIRTDEFSQRFSAQLATYEEIEHLAERRKRSIELRQGLIERAKERFNTHVEHNYSLKSGVIGDIDVTMWIAILPMFPGLFPSSISNLEKAIDHRQLGARDMKFPNGSPQSQHEGFFFSDPRVKNFSYLELSSHRSIFYAEELGYVMPDNREETDLEPSPDQIYVYLSWILAWAIFYLRYSDLFYSNIGYDGSLLLRFGLDRIRGRQFRVSLDDSGNKFQQGRPMLDDEIVINRELHTDDLGRDLFSISKDLLRSISFSCGWINAFSAGDDFIELCVDRALGYLKWTRETLLK